MVSSVALPATLTISHVLNAAFPPPDGAGSGGAEAVAIHVIPQGPEPRWIILGDARKAVPVLRSWWPFKISTRLRWAAILGASSLDLLSRVPGVINQNASIDRSYWRNHLPGFCEDWTPVIHVGNRSHTRKAIVFFVGPRGGCKAVAKVPLVAEAAGAILNEADILRNLRGRRSVPEPLFEDKARGIAAQAWVAGRAVSRKLTAQHIEFLAGLEIPGSTQRVSDRRGPLAGSLSAIDLTYNRATLDRALALLKYDAILPGFVEHRDFAPWNLKTLPDGTTGAIDWEWAVADGLPCQDIFRYFFIQDVLFDGPGRVWQQCNASPLVQAYYSRFAIPGEALLPLVTFYLLRVLVVESEAGNTRLADYAFEQLSKLV